MKKLFSFALFAFCISLSVTSQGQSIILLADNVQGSSLIAKGAIDVISMGTSLSCGACLVVPSTSAGSSVGKIVPSKIVFNMPNEIAVNKFKTALLLGLNGKAAYGDAYFVFAKPPGTPNKGAYYYIKLLNYTILEIDEAADNAAHSVQVSLGFSGLIWTEKSSTGSTSFGWDFSKNIAITGSAIPTGF